MTMDRNDKLVLPFTVFWADTHPAYVMGTWSCTLVSPGKKSIGCPGADKYVKLAYEKGFLKGNFTILPNIFAANDKVYIFLNVKELKTN